MLWASTALLLGEAFVDLAKLSGALPVPASSVARQLRTAIRVFSHNGSLDEAGNASRILEIVKARESGQTKRSYPQTPYPQSPYR